MPSLPSPEDIFNKLIIEISSLIPHLKDKLQLTLPHSFDGQEFSIIFDPEFDETDLQEILKYKKNIENCLKRITGKKDAQLKIEKKNEILSPRETINLHSRNVRKLIDTANQDPFIQKIIQKFNGKIIDVWGSTS